MNPFNKRAVVELLQTFSKTELREFKQYVERKGSKSTIALWTVLHKSHPKYQLKDADIYKKVRQKPFNDNTYRVWVADLTRLAKEFVTIQEFQANEHLFNNTLSLALLKRRVEKMGQKALGNQANRLKQTPRPDTDYYYHCFEHQDISYQYVTMLAHRATTDSLQKAADFLDHSYLVKKLKFLCVMYNRQRIVKEDYQFHLENEILAYLEANPVEKVPLLHLYFLVLRMIRDLSDHVAFEQFIDYYKHNRQQIASTESRQMAIAALNFCYWNILQGQLQLLTPRLVLAEIMIEEGFIWVADEIPEYHFRNHVNIAIEANELDWASKFIDDFLPKTNPQHRANLEAYSRAYLHFAKEEYEKQAAWMLQMEAQDFSFIDSNTEIAFRILRLKTAFQQLGPKPKPLANEAFRANLETFRNFLPRRPSLPQNERDSANNFQKALKQLHQKKQGNVSRVGDLKSYILGLQPIRELPWLLGRAGKLL